MRDCLHLILSLRGCTTHVVRVVSTSALGRFISVCLALFSLSRSGKRTAFSQRLSANRISVRNEIITAGTRGILTLEQLAVGIVERVQVSFVRPCKDAKARMREVQLEYYLRYLDYATA